MRMLSNIEESVFDTEWLVSWATGVSKALQLSFNTNFAGALPLGSVAVLVNSEHDSVTPVTMGKFPLEFYKVGHLFCYLPLPILSSADFHVNVCFAVTSTRQRLQTNTEDDKYSYDTQWNEALLSDAVARSLINVLVHLTKLNPTDDYKFYQFWPMSTTSVTEPLRRGFYESAVLSDLAVFKSSVRWLGISECIFLNQNMSEDPKIATAAISTIQKFRSDVRKGVVNLPLMYVNELEKTVGWRERAYVVSEEEFFTEYFLPHVGDIYWLESDQNIVCRNNLLLYCLRHATANIDELLKSIDCISTKPGGELRKPPDIVHPEGRVAGLFEIDDRRFPEQNFSANDILAKLHMLGMIK